MRAQTAHKDSAGNSPRVLNFDDNRLLVSLFGQHDENLAYIEQSLDVEIVCRGNRVAIGGDVDNRDLAAKVLNALYARVRGGQAIDLGEVEGVIRMSGAANTALTEGTRRVDKQGPSKAAPAASVQINTRKRTIAPRTPRQARFIEQMLAQPMTFGVGPAGTGKTYLAVAMAVARMLAGDIDRIIVSRPAVEAGESLGFLPGDMKEKVDPYLRPIYDALFDVLPTGQVERYIETGQIEIAPLAFMRGRTLSDAFVILDEAQNTTIMQMKMFLTRFGANSRMVIAGDPTQIDLPGGAPSGLIHALDILHGVNGVSVVRFGEDDVVRHQLVGRIVGAYEAADGRSGDSATKAPLSRN